MGRVRRRRREHCTGPSGFHASASRPHQHHRQYARRAAPVRRLARDDAAGALSQARARPRNLGFSGDEIGTRPRSKNFGTPDEWLSGLGAPIGGYEDNRFAGTETKADVVFAFFGYNESFAGDAGLAQMSVFLTTALGNLINSGLPG